MTHLAITPNLAEAPWNDLAGTGAERGMATIERIGLLPQGMLSGRPTLTVLVALPDGTKVMAEASWVQMRTAFRALVVSPVAEADADRHPE